MVFGFWFFFHCLSSEYDRLINKQKQKTDTNYNINRNIENINQEYGSCNHETNRMIRKEESKYDLSPDQITNMYTNINYSTVFPKVQLLCLAVFLNMVVTFLFFPSLCIGIKSQINILNKNNWIPVIMVTEFNIFDFIGTKWISSLTLFWNEKNLWLLSLLRFVVYPIFLLLYKGYFQSDLLVHTTMIFSSVTNGYIGALSYMWAPNLLTNNQKEQEIGTSIMTTCLLLGIVSGSLISLFLTHENVV